MAPTDECKAASVRELHVRDKQNLTRIETLAREILQQVDHLRRNGPGDEIRFAFIELRGYDLFMLARRGFRRYERQRADRA